MSISNYYAFECRFLTACIGLKQYKLVVLYTIQYANKVSTVDSNLLHPVFEIVSSIAVITFFFHVFTNLQQLSGFTSVVHIPHTAPWCFNNKDVFQVNPDITTDWDMH